jgi:hypothetical protein
MKRITYAFVAVTVFAIWILAILPPMAKASADIVIVQHHHFYTPPTTALNISIGAIYWVMGEVKNVGDAPATNITVTANFYDASNDFINSTTTSLQAVVSFLGTSDTSVLMPGQKAPFFEIMFDEKSGAKNVDHYNLSISFSPSPPVQPMLLLAVDKVIDYKSPINPANAVSLYVNGTIKNTGTVTSDSYYVFVTGYDSNGSLLGSTYYSGSSLAAGATDAFDVTVNNNYNLDPTAVKDFATFAITAQSAVFNDTLFRYFSQYTSVSDITGVVPEFPSILGLLLLLTATAAIMIFSKNRRH